MSFKRLDSVLKIKIFLTVFFCLLIIPTIVQAYPVTWNPVKVEQEIGIAGAEDLTATFTSSTDLTNVDLWVVPELQPYISVEPNHFNIIQANTPYEVTLHFSLPFGSPSGFYDGTIHIKGGIKGKRTYPQTLKVELSVDAGNIILPPTTKAIDVMTLQSLSSATEDGTLTFDESSPVLESLSPGDIVILGISENTPFGLLRKVTSISENGGQIIIETTQGTLNEAIQEGTFEIIKTLTPNDISSAVVLKQGVSFSQSQATELSLGSFNLNLNTVLYDLDGNLSTTSDQVKINGSISIEPSFHFYADMSLFTLNELTFTTTLNENADLELSANVALSIDEKVEIARYYFTPIVIGPVIITPVLTVIVGVDGEVTVGLTTSITQNASLTAGLNYYYGDWSPISDFSTSFDYNPPTLSANTYVKGYAGPQLSLLVYGVTGPYAEIDGYLKLDADLFSIPRWELYGGLEAGVGVKLEIYSFLIADYYLKVIDYSILLDQSPYYQANLLEIKQNHFYKDSYAKLVNLISALKNYVKN